MTQTQTEFSYRNIQLYKSESLGSGSYGGVCKAKCDGLLCAAKIMHPTLFDLRDPGAASYLCKFREECHLLSLARHPNVVQYLGTYTDPDTRLPVLLMELCDESLTGFLERSPGPLSYHIQVNICHDIALALIYLHSNGLIHRDLTGNNILMIAGPRAKITDFGMSKLATVNPRMTALTLCPGNVLYMSPEALDDAKTYTSKLDMFSFGVIIIQIVTRLFPSPTDRFRCVTTASTTEDSDEDEVVDVRQVVPDKERRKEHLHFIPDSHALKPLALSCLKKRERLRLSALDLSKRIGDLKESPQYAESQRQVQQTSSSSIQQPITSESQNHHEEITKLQGVIRDKSKELEGCQRLVQSITSESQKHHEEITKLQGVIRDKGKEVEDCQRLVRSMERQLHVARQTIEEKSMDLWAKNTELMNITRALRRKENELREVQADQSKQAEVAKYTESTWKEAVKQEDKESKQVVETTTSKLEISQIPVQKEIWEPFLSVEEHGQVEDEPVIVDMPTNVSVGLPEAASRRRNIRSMTWTRGKSAPEELRRGVSAVLGSKAYFRPANSVKVYCYDNIVGIQNWSLLPENPNTNCGLVVVNDILTSVGGIGYNHSTKTLLSLVDGKKEEKEWHEVYPHMAIPRYGAACLATDKVLVVAGGLTADEGLNTVEVMKTDTKQWNIVCSLPRKCFWMSPAVFGNTLYLAGGFVGDKPSNNVFSCSISNLLSSSAIGSKILWSFSSSLGAWKEVSHMPLTRSTLASFGGDLLAVGGEDGSGKPTTDIHGYNSNTDSWIRVSQMKDERSWCLAVSLPETGLVVVGGFTDRIDNITSGVEILN